MKMVHALVFTFGFLLCLNASHTTANTRYDLLSSAILKNPIHSSSVNVKTFFWSLNAFQVASIKLWKKKLLSWCDKRPQSEMMALLKEHENFSDSPTAKYKHRWKLACLGSSDRWPTRLFVDYDYLCSCHACFSFSFYFVKKFSKHKLVRTSSEFGAKHNFVLRNAAHFLCLSVIAHALDNVAGRFFTPPDRCKFHGWDIVLTKAWFLTGASFRRANNKTMLDLLTRMESTYPQILLFPTLKYNTE